MFNPFNRENPDLDEAIHSAYQDLKAHSADEEGYQKAVDQIVKLEAMKRKPIDIDPNKMAMVLGNLFVARMVIKYEQTGVITSKVMAFMSKF